MNITGSLITSISLGPISFDNTNMFALIKKLKIYKTFIVGAYQYETNEDNLLLINDYLDHTIFNNESSQNLYMCTRF